MMKLMQDYFTATVRLTSFLIERQGHYSQTTNGLVFHSDEDAQEFNKQLDSMARLQARLNSRGH